MTGLPYIKPPQTFPPRRIGNDASGILEVPVLGGLTVEESDTMARLQADDVSPFVIEVETAAAMAAAEECSIMEAYKVVKDGTAGLPLDNPLAEAMRLRHARQIDEVAKVFNAAGSRTMTAGVTAIIRHRLGRPDWTVAETLKLPRQLRKSLWQLVTDEQDAEALPVEPVTEEDLKKPPVGDGSPSEQTGEPFSGGCATPTPDSGTGKRSPAS
jgi:hypothetical protein